MILFSMIVALAVIALILHLSDIIDNEDFIPKRQFKKKLVKNRYKNTWELIQMLLYTSAKDWKRECGAIAFEPFPHTKILFNCQHDFGIVIEEGRKGIYMFEMVRSPNGKEDLYGYGYGYDVITKHHLDAATEFELEQVLEHLKEIYLELHPSEKLRENLVVNTPTNRKKQKQAQLYTMMQKHPVLFDDVEENDLLFRFKREKHGQSFSIFLEKNLYFQAVQTITSATVATKIHNDLEKDAEIFTEIEPALIAYATSLFPQTIHTSNHQALGVVHEPLLTAIYEQLHQLQEERLWLNMESLHQIDETFPHDLQALCEAYQVIQNKETVQSDIESSLKTITTKLAQFSEEIEHNKQQMITKRKYIIEKR